MIPDDIKAHLRAIDRWLEDLGRMPNQPSGLSEEERKQLKAVNRAVGQLQRSGVPVPDDLRNMKLKLSARDVVVSQDHAIAVRLKQIEGLMLALTTTVKAARAVRERLKSKIQAGGPKKHYGVRISDLIRAGLLTVEDRLELQWLIDGPVFEGKLKADGAVMVKTPGGWQRYGSLSTAATRAAGRPLNGWKHWRRANSDGTATVLDEIRAGYLNQEAEE